MQLVLFVLIQIHYCPEHTEQGIAYYVSQMTGFPENLSGRLTLKKACYRLQIQSLDTGIAWVLTRTYFQVLEDASLMDILQREQTRSNSG